MASGQENLLIRVSRRAMACEFEVCFPAGSCAGGAEFALESLDQVESLEEQLSYFRPTSEISRINLLAAESPIEVEPRLFDLLSLAMRLREETGGAYDITSAPLWEAWGFARRAGEIPSDADLADARTHVGGQFVELDPARRTIRFHKPGVKINVGSIGKGFALDGCAERLRLLGMTNFLVQGGKSSVLARDECPFSNSPHPNPLPKGEGTAGSGGRPWEVGVQHPRQTGKRLGVVRLHNRALGTSGGQFQSFRHRGHRYGHILDPRSGHPAEGVLSTTVTAPTAALADALSTAFYVLGPQPSLDYCRKHPEIGMMMFSVAREGDPRGGDVELHRAGLENDDWAIGM
jgi:thiamine biosynthesis lipoprotein